MLIYLSFSQIFFLQANQLYYDAENGTYYIYDYTTKQYQIHSHVELPSKEYDPSEDICTIVSNKATTLNDRVVEEEKLTELDKMFEDGELLCVSITLFCCLKIIFRSNFIS